MSTLHPSAASMRARLGIMTAGLLTTAGASIGSYGGEFSETVRLLDELEVMIEERLAAKEHITHTRLAETQRQVNEAIALIDSITNSSCSEPGTLYLSTTSNLQPSCTIVIQGISGWQMFTFASGTSQTNIIAAINTFTDNQTGVTARQCADNPQRVELNSLMVGQGGFVSVAQVGGPPPVVFNVSTGGIGSYQLFDDGLDGLAGDVDCDRLVNVIDLMLVIQNWGDCPLPPLICTGNVDGNTTVGVGDLLRVINKWGTSD